jgi:hypothetical protein
VQAAVLALVPKAVVNQSGAVVESNGVRWLGTGANAALSRLGLIFTLPDLPATTFKSATLVLTSAWTQWIPVDVSIGAELSGNPADFGPRALPSDRPLTIPIAHFNENTKWGAHGTYEIDVTEPVRALLARFSRPAAIALIAAGAGSPWGRKYFTTAGEMPTLKLAFDDPPAPPPRPVVARPAAVIPAPAPVGAAAGTAL